MSSRTFESACPRRPTPDQFSATYRGALPAADRRGLLPATRARSKLRDGAAGNDKQSREGSSPSESYVSFFGWGGIADLSGRGPASCGAEPKPSHYNDGKELQVGDLRASCIQVDEPKTEQSCQIFRQPRRSRNHRHGLRVSGSFCCARSLSARGCWIKRADIEVTSSCSRRIRHRT